MIDTVKESCGGMMGLPMPEIPTTWTMYIQVDDMDAASGKFQKLGGKVLMPRTQALDIGWFVIASAIPRGPPSASDRQKCNRPARLIS
ncbi:hypothetical protein DFAR_2090004 [Desulfarculales bacterium]